MSLDDGKDIWRDERRSSEVAAKGRFSFLALALHRIHASRLAFAASFPLYNTGPVDILHHAQKVYTYDF